MRPSEDNSDFRSTMPAESSGADSMSREAAHVPPGQPSTAMAGTSWGEHDRYVIDRQLGRGGMGTVYAATDTLLGRVVALKVLDAAEVRGNSTLLFREAKLAASVEHERVARIYDVGQHRGSAFVAMEYVQGRTLRQWMDGHVPTAHQVLEIATQIAEGLAQLHAKRVIHRDLKPENVMLNSRCEVKLLDFGLARQALVHDGGTSPGPRAPAARGMSGATVAGTPGYMAPEQWAGLALDAQVDIFALGVIVYELVSGQRPFRGDTVSAIMDATFRTRPSFAGEAWTGMPPRLAECTARMLSRRPENRFADGGSALAALRDVRGSPPSNARLVAAVPRFDMATTLQPPSRPPRWRRLARHVAEWTTVVSSVVLVGTSLLPDHPAAAPPPGMVRVDVGAIAVGRDVDEIAGECRELGAGCPREQLMREVPRTSVQVGPYFLDRDEVTNDAFVEMLNMYSGALAVADDEDLHYPRFVHRNAGTGGEDEPILDLDPLRSGIELELADHTYRVRPGHEELPVTQVSWYGARLYCESLGKRLPTENEWEAAARGRQDRRYPWGDAPVRCGDVVFPNDGRLVMPTSCPKDAAPRPVGQAAQDVTPEGVRGLAGNAAEWTSTLFVDGGRAASSATAGREAPRVIRGGSWADSRLARTSSRGKWPATQMGANLGFRCAADAEGAR